MRTFVAIVLGFLSGVMLFPLACEVTNYRITDSATLAGAWVALLAGWAISAYFMRRNAATTSAVFCRGSLAGAAEWLAMIPRTPTTREDYENLPNSVPVVLAETLLPWLAAGMAAVCLITFAIAYFAGRRASGDALPAPAAPPRSA